MMNVISCGVLLRSASSRFAASEAVTFVDTDMGGSSERRLAATGGHASAGDAVCSCSLRRWLRELAVVLPTGIGDVVDRGPGAQFVGKQFYGYHPFAHLQVRFGSEYQRTLAVSLSKQTKIHRLSVRIAFDRLRRTSATAASN
jgi:hypothetical protein